MGRSLSRANLLPANRLECIQKAVILKSQFWPEGAIITGPALYQELQGHDAVSLSRLVTLPSEPLPTIVWVHWADKTVPYYASIKEG